MENGTTIEKLFEGLDVEIHGNRTIQLTGISSHSKWVSPGDLFVAKKGLKFDGNQCIPEAIESGASAILTNAYHPTLKDVTQIIHPNPACIEPEIANRIFCFPSKDLFLIAITGTNGKTTTAYLIQHLLDTQTSPCGLMGTIETCIGKMRIPSQLTTQDIVTNQKYLYQMRQQGSRNAVMEVTSHALAQGRVKGLDFNLGIFTNLSQDHLDYHGSMENYLQEKAKLFKMVDTPQKVAILNADDPASFQLLGKSRAKVFTYGIDHLADFQAKEIKSSLDGTSFTLVYKGKQVRIKTKLLGTFNILNILASFAACFCRGLHFEQLQSKLMTFPGVPGRLESIANPQGIYLFVDFAHTEKALKQVLSVLQQVKKGRILTVFGCGGDRDRSKRSKMGDVASKFSDQLILTSDNPRTEEPHLICNDIARGVKNKNQLIIELDRKKAIAKSIALAQKEDIVLIAGRGHEPFQKIGERVIPFDDREVARDICNHSF